MYITNHLERLLGDVIYIRIFKILILHSEGLTGRTLAQMAKTSSFKISHVLRNLVSQGVLTETVVGRAHIYRLNSDHIFTKAVLRPLIKFEQTLLENLGTTLLKKLEPKPLSIILYGSVARKEELANSDFDLLLIYKNKTLPAKTSALGSIAEFIARTYGNMASFKSVSIPEFQQRIHKKDPFFQNIIREGIPIAGSSLTQLLEYGHKTQNHKRPKN